MSGGEALGRYWVDAALGVGDEHPIPLDPATGRVKVIGSATVASLVQLSPDSVIYQSAAPEVFSIIPAVALPGTLANIAARIATSGITTPWIQVFAGVVQPAANARPLWVSIQSTTPGGMVQFDFTPNGINRAAGYVVVLSTAQDTYVEPNTAILLVTATGKP